MSQPRVEPEAIAGAQDPASLLREAQRVLSAVYHDANNPLSIIAGNAQFLMEIAKMQALGDEFVQPLQDIDESCQRVAVKLRDLIRLREQIALHLGRQHD